MNILIADDHELVRAGLIRVIVQEFPKAKIHEVENGKDAEKCGRKDKWDIMILDMAMPEKSGLEVLKQLRAEAIKTPVLLFSIHPESQYAIRVLKAGGNGYLSKDCHLTDFVAVIRTIMSGRKYISPSVAEKLAAKFDSDPRKEEHELISDRELQVLKLIASGKAVSDIADELSLSIATISTYRHRLLEKMQLKNNAELIHYAINNGLA
ncbi:MAG TPA: response regulator transcription factor [Bacteroidia bacterium]|nr:response regulator transcription factor [Bacteroidia bacterium]